MSKVSGGLPSLRLGRMAPEDREQLQRARRAATDCHAAIEAVEDVAHTVTVDLLVDLRRLTGQVYKLGEALGRARGFVRASSPEALARRRAELELDAMGTGAAERAAREDELAAVTEQHAHAVAVSAEIVVLEAQLAAAVGHLENLRARTERLSADPSAPSGGMTQLLGDLRRYRLEADTALEAYARTRAEIAGL